jgi:hypothetical protein
LKWHENPIVLAPVNLSKSEMLRPLEIYSQLGAQHTLFQQWAALTHVAFIPCATPCIEELAEGNLNASSNSNAKGNKKLMLGVDEREDVDHSINRSRVHYD